MDLERYNDAASIEVPWHLYQLWKEGVDGVWNSGIILGTVGIHNILTQQASEISQFLSLPPGQRTKRLAKMTDSVERHGFLIAATYKIRCGVA